MWVLLIFFFLIFVLFYFIFLDSIKGEAKISITETAALEVLHEDRLNAITLQEKLIAEEKVPL